MTVFVMLMTNAAIAQNCNFRLSGHVEDEDVKDKLTAAVVTIMETGDQRITDARGDFLFENLCAGTYTVQITHVSCDTLIKKISVSKDVHYDFYLPHARKVLGEVVLQSQKSLPPGIKKELSGEALRNTRGLSLAESLSILNGVTLLQTGATISKPVIHGLHGSRILTINNGVRQEGQQWGNEHAPEIDPYIADKLTVIKGVDELMYGSDAIGGVVLVQPRPLRFSPGVQTEWNSGYFTNNRQMVFSGIAEFTPFTRNRWAFRLQGTHKRGANVKTPDYRLNNTAMKETGLSFTAGYNGGAFTSELFYSAFTTALGIFEGAHIGNLTDLLTAIESNKPDAVYLGENTYTIERPRQEVEHHLVKWKGRYTHRGHSFQATLAAQFNNRQEYDVVRSNNNTPQMDLFIRTFSQDLVWEQPTRKGFKGTAGLSFTQQKNSYNGRYFIPNYFAYTLGGFYLEKWKKHRWELQGGVRFDHKSVETSRLRFGGTVIDNDFRFNTLAGSLNVLYTVHPRWVIQTSASLSSRAPYVNELLSDGIHHGAATYEKGKLDLVPEKSLHLSTGVTYNSTNRAFQAEVLLFSHYIRDFIYRKPVPDSPVLTIAGAFPQVVYSQTHALLQGADASFQWSVVPAISWTAKMSLLYAKDRRANDWLIGMPANRYTTGVTYQVKDSKHWKQTRLTLDGEHVTRQTRIPDETLAPADYKLPPEAFTLMNLHFSTTRHIGAVPVTVRISVRNLLNTTYRQYLNSMRYFTDEMGRNVGIHLNVPIHFKKINQSS
ncbi:MAG TPA: TonB-dependent receptor [Ferruginibacter sp.]|nr:TonB-dependent receptor [Ferruginibacter sp.]